MMKDKAAELGVTLEQFRNPSTRPFWLVFGRNEVAWRMRHELGYDISTIARLMGVKDRKSIRNGIGHWEARLRAQTNKRRPELSQDKRASLVREMSIAIEEMRLADRSPGEAGQELINGGFPRAWVPNLVEDALRYHKRKFRRDGKQCGPTHTTETVSPALTRRRT